MIELCSQVLLNMARVIYFLPQVLFCFGKWTTACQVVKCLVPIYLRQSCYQEPEATPCPLSPLSPPHVSLSLSLFPVCLFGTFARYFPTQRACTYNLLPPIKVGYTSPPTSPPNRVTHTLPQSLQRRLLSNHPPLALVWYICCGSKGVSFFILKSIWFCIEGITQSHTLHWGFRDKRWFWSSMVWIHL